MAGAGRVVLVKVLENRKENGINDAFYTNELSSFSPIGGLVLTVHYLKSKCNCE